MTQLLLALVLVTSFLTLVSRFEEPQTSDLASETPRGRTAFCGTSLEEGGSLYDYFAIRRALHFHKVIRKSLARKKGAEAQLKQIGILLDGINQEILTPGGGASYSKIDSWFQIYPAAEKYRWAQGLNRRYDLNAFFSMVEQDVHIFFYKLLKTTVLPQHLWVVKEQGKIQSLGVRLEEEVWARLGIFPNEWHLHIFHSKEKGTSGRPLEDLPVQSLTARFWGEDQIEILGGRDTSSRYVAKSPEEMQLTPYCEWVAGQGRRNHLSQQSLKDL